MKKSTTKYVVMSGLFAALYTALTYFSAIFSLAYGPIQLRLSEILTVLPVFTPYAIPGLCIGCFFGNLSSFNPIDLVFGTAATLIAACFTRLFRNKLTFGVPLISMFSPVIINALVIGAELSIFYLGGFTLLGFLITAGQVAIGEFIVAVLGIPFYKILKKYENNIFK